MATTTARQFEVPSMLWNRLLTRILLACGIGYAAAYVLANDVVAASRYPGYSRLDQAVSELSAIGAPSMGFLRAMLPVFALLMFGFALGVIRTAETSRALRVTGALLVASSVVGFSWLWFPMTSRAQMGSGAMAGNDLGHLVLSGLSVLLILLQMGFSAAALGRSFRLFSGAAAVTMLSFGAVMSATASRLAPGVSTPWMGLLERVMLGAWLVWMSVFAVVLLRRK